MHLELDRKEFLRALQLGGSFAGKNKTIPLLYSVKIEVRGTNLFVTSNDIENEICVKSQVVSSDSDGLFCIEYSDILNFVKLIPSVQFTMDVTDSECIIKHSKGNISIPVTSANEFPVLKGESHTEFDIDNNVFKDLVFKAKDFVANDELRPVMNGVYIYNRNGEFGCAASDSHTLFTNSVEYSGFDKEVDFIINPKAIIPIVNLCDSSSTDIKVKVGERDVTCKSDICRITFRKIDGRFPNFNAVIPKENKITSDISKLEFLNSLSRVKLTASKATQLIKLRFDQMMLDICSDDIDFGRKGSESITSSTNGNITIGVKADNIEKCLKATDSDSVRMLMNDETRAIVIKNANEDKKTILIMPMMLNY
ncbi:MAG: DNA polymerase III subunit beta [Bacteroidales bacterium]